MVSNEIHGCPNWMSHCYIRVTRADCIENFILLFFLSVVRYIIDELALPDKRSNWARAADVAHVLIFHIIIMLFIFPYKNDVN